MMSQHLTQAMQHATHTHTHAHVTQAAGVRQAHAEDMHDEG